MLLSKVSANGGFRDGDLPPVLDVESTEGQTDAEFSATLDHSVGEIYRASVDKQVD